MLVITLPLYVGHHLACTSVLSYSQTQQIQFRLSEDSVVSLKNVEFY